MAKRYKIIAIILILVLCSTFTGKKESNNYSDVTVTVAMSKMDYITKHNIFSGDNGIKYIGHRGIGGLAPENTLPSFELAGKLKFWGTECDVRTTSDGNWIILHDDSVDRMTNGTGKIKNLSLSKVNSLTINSGKNIGDYKGVKILKLQDYLLICKKWGIVPVIDMKPSDNLRHYDKFIQILKKNGDVKKIVVISSSTESLKELRRRDKYLTLGLLCSDINASNINFVKSLGNAFINSSCRNITSSQVTLCHENNIKVGAWTVDDILIADSLIQKGVDYLTTNKLLPEVKQQRLLAN